MIYSVIRGLGERVEREHSQYLRDSQRNADRAASIDGGNPLPQLGGTVDFKSLVSSTNKSQVSDRSAHATRSLSSMDPMAAFSTTTGTSTITGATTGNAANGTNGTAKATSWEDDVWGSILESNNEVSWLL